MRLPLIILVAYLFAYCNTSKDTAQMLSREKSFDTGWRFSKDSVDGAEQPGFNDSGWRVLDTPHDWSIEDLPVQVEGKTVGPFSRESGGPMNGSSNAHAVGGTAWYRKHFILDSADRNKLFSIYFEGVYMETDLWINGNFVGAHKHGYTSFFFDITRFCHAPGQQNTIAVRVRNKGQNSRWYSGSGIYRHVKLVVTSPLHVQQWGVYITTPEVSRQKAIVKIATRVVNAKSEDSDYQLTIRILNDKNEQVGRSEGSSNIKSNDSALIAQDIAISSPRLWSPDTPYLYTAQVTLKSGDKMEDMVSNEFGIRSLRFDRTSGFELNGMGIKLKGGCVHHDNGILGSAAIDRAEEKKVELLKSYGFNAVRSSHYPPSEKFLQTCDRLGMLVIDEAFDMWQKPKNPDDYHLYFDEHHYADLSSMVMRDRNHPSVIFWSLGNEIQERADTSGLAIIKELKARVKELDPSRPITMAICEFWDNPGRPWAATAPTFELLDIGGYNYQWWQYEPDHEKFPQRIMMGTESVPIHALQNWQLVEKHPYVIGDFVWTAMDYLGESGIGHTSCENEKETQLMPWPWFNANCGDIDLIGNKKPQSFFRDVIWGRSNIELAIHKPLARGCKEKVSYWGWPEEEQSWNWKVEDGTKMDVSVYSRYKVVRLKQNDRVIGEKNIADSNLMTAKFEVGYQIGKLTAVGVENGKEADSVTLSTTGPPAAMRLKVDRSTIKADKNDLAYVMVEVVDEHDKIVPDAQIPVEFVVGGAGIIAGVGNANPSDMASFKKPMRTTFRGRCLVILQPTGAGQITLEARSPGLKAAKNIVTAE